MKAVILAGGFGTRLAEYTSDLPKPMVRIGGTPILLHIMDHYAHFGVTEFIIAAGYKSEVIKRFFLELPLLAADFQVNTLTGKTTRLSSASERDWNVTVVDTGLESMTGGRLLRLKKYLEGETFFLTYGDGLSNVNINFALQQHKSEKNLVTVTAVRPSARFGELEVDGTRVISFQEKPQLRNGWINGGFFVVDSEFLDYIDDDKTILEQDPLEKVASAGLLGAHLHEGFWQCMDTKRDRDYLDQLCNGQSPPWLEL